MIRVVNQREYFILDIDTGELRKFTNRTDFIKKGDELNLAKIKDLTFSRLFTEWKRYESKNKRTAFAACIQTNK